MHHLHIGQAQLQAQAFFGKGQIRKDCIILYSRCLDWPRKWPTGAQQLGISLLHTERAQALQVFHWSQIQALLVKLAPIISYTVLLLYAKQRGTQVSREWHQAVSSEEWLNQSRKPILCIYSGQSADQGRSAYYSIYPEAKGIPFSAIWKWGVSWEVESAAGWCSMFCLPSFHSENPKSAAPLLRLKGPRVLESGVRLICIVFLILNAKWRFSTYTTKAFLACIIVSWVWIGRYNSRGCCLLYEQKECNIMVLLLPSPTVSWHILQHKDHTRQHQVHSVCSGCYEDRIHFVSFLCWKALCWILTSHSTLVAQLLLNRGFLA